MQNFPNKIIVFGGNHHNTLGVIRSLGEAGITPILILHGTSQSFVAQSKYINETHYVKNEEEGINLIINKYSSEKLPPIIICCSDGASHCIDINYNKLKGHFIYPNAEQEGHITTLMDKEHMRILAEQCGLITPRTWIISPTDSIPEDIIYPCIIKPLLSIEGSKNDIHICYDKTNLQLDLDSVHTPKVQIQEYINKDYEFQLIGCVIKTEQKRQIIIPGVSQIIRSSSISNTGFLKYIPINKTKDIELDRIKQFILKTQYIGLFSVEFIKSQKGNNYFMEINFRNDGNAYAVTGSGCNLPYIWCKGMLGHINENHTIPKETFVIPELIDFLQSVLTHKISLFRWMKDVIKSDTYLLYNKHDKKPFYFELKYYMSRAFIKVKKKCLNVYWNIGFIEKTDNLLEKSTWDIHWMQHSYKNRWFADPFILKITDHEIIVLVEEFYDPIQRGRISKLTIDKTNYTLKKIDVILELNSHLSFPAIFRNENKIYIYPENSQEGSLTIYELDENNNTLLKKRILSEEPLTDAILTTDFNATFLFSTKLPIQNSNKLFIYKLDKQNNDCKIFQTIEFPTNTARNAGALFHIGNKIIRPAQDCNGAYGKGLIFYEVVYTENHFEMKELKRIYPQHTIYSQGMHTFNVYQDLIVVDGRKYRKPFISNTLLFINRLLKKVQLK